jgi:secondary thiamine-phosphate synthase enzyme
MMTFTVESRHQNEMIEISDQVRSAVARSGIRNGLALVFTPHTTADVTINENADPDVVTDMLHGLDRLVPLRDNYRHLEGNSAAHIKSSLIGAGETLIVADGTTVLGTWQGIYFCEFDGPRTRKVLVRVLGA